MVIFIVIVAVLLIPVIGALALKPDYTIETNLNINRSAADVFNYVKFLKNSDHFNKWVMLDPASRKEYVGTDGTVGFIFKWDSDNKNVGQGEQEIKNLTGNQRIDYEIRFIKPFAAVSQSSIVLKPVGADQTNISWSFSGTRNFAMKIFHFIFNLKKVLRKDLHTSLENLKGVLEK